MDGLKTSLKMKTTFGISIVESMDHVWYRSAKEVCALPLKTQITEVPWGHFYLIMFLLIPFAKVMDITVLFAALQGLVYTSVLAFVYLLARKKGIGMLSSALLVLLASQHPLWHQGLLGQFYFNRLFLPFAALIILLLEDKKIRYFWLIVASLLAASTNEIYGISIFLIYASFAWVRGRFNWKLIFSGVFFLGLSIGLMTMIQKSLGFKSTQTSFLDAALGHGLQSLLSLISTNLSNPDTIIYFMVNMVFFGILSLLNLRLLIPLGVMLLPNVLVNLGGAEKTGWSTHYHIGYFLPLLWLGVLGISRLTKVKRVQQALLVVLIVISTLINPLAPSINSKPFIALRDLSHRISYYRFHSRYDQKFREDLRNAVGDNTSISAPEAIVYNLYDHDIYYYPMNIDFVDVVIFRVTEGKTGVDSLSSINYGHQDPKLDDCIKDRMRNHGFDLDNPTLIGGWAVVKKIAK